MVAVIIELLAHALQNSDKKRETFDSQDQVMYFPYPMATQLPLVSLAQPLIEQMVSLMGISSL